MLRALRLRPRLELLDDRLVPSATVLDLTTAGATATAPSGAIVQETDTQPTGTGVIRSFVRIQGASSGGGIEQGYNTDGRPLQFDENKSPQFTRSLTLGQVPIVTVDGVDYRQFLLDINQKASSPLLSLDEVRIFLGSTGNLTGYDTTAQTLAGQTAVFDLDSGGDVSVLLNYKLNHGSGSGDMFLLVPNADFAGADPSSFMYLYSKFGGLPGASANSGFEEWAVKSTPPAVLPPTGSLSGFVGFPDESNPNGFTGIAGVAVHLRGTDANGDTVVLNAVTDSEGNFTFTNVPMGTYTLMEDMPVGFVGSSEIVGSLGGSTGTSTTDGTITDIVFAPDNASNDGTGYIFLDHAF